MKLGTAIAEIMKREGIEILCGYPVNHLIEHAAKADIRPVMVRQERVGIHMADAISRVTSGRNIGAFCMQHGPGAENAMGGVAQCFGESVPALVLPMGYQRRPAHIEPNFNSSEAMKSFIASVAKQFRLSPRSDSGLLCCARNDGVWRGGAALPHFTCGHTAAFSRPVSNETGSPSHRRKVRDRPPRRGSRWKSAATKALCD